MTLTLLSLAFAAPPDVSELTVAASPVALDGTEPLYGRPDARFQVVEFVDFACPHCATASTELPAILTRHPSMNLRVKLYPLAGACNPDVSRAGGNDRCDAAYAATCAHELGRYDAMANWLFAEGRFGAADLTQQALALGFDPNAWNTCMTSPATQNRVRASARAGHDLGLKGTPTFYVSGVVPGQWVEIVGGGTERLEQVITAAEANRPPPTPPPGPEPGAHVTADLGRGVYLSVTGTGGTLDPRPFEVAALQGAEGIRGCLVAGRELSSGLHGEIRVKVIVGARGKAAEATVLSSTLQAPAVERCVTDRFMHLRYPPPKDGVSMANYLLMYPP